jgi:hypothetical protein
MVPNGQLAQSELALQAGDNNGSGSVPGRFWCSAIARAVHHSEDK